MEWLKSLVATSRLSRKTYRSIANRADRRFKAVLAPYKAAMASASKTSALRLRDRVWRSAWRLYWYVTDPALVAPSKPSLFEPSEKTCISLLGIVGRNSRKSSAA